MERFMFEEPVRFSAYDHEGLVEALRMKDQEQIRQILQDAKKKFLSSGVPEIECKLMAVGIFADVYYQCAKKPNRPFTDEALMFTLKGLIFRTESETLFEQLEQFCLIAMGTDGDRSVISENVKQSSLRRAIACMHREFANPSLKMGDVAQQAFISVSYMTMMLKRETGLTFSELLTRIRLEHAKELLATADLKSYEVATMCGFANASYFSSVFRNTYGMTPTEFRIKSSKQGLSE